MNPIFQALSQGYNPQQILNYLSSAIPNFAGPISKATASGYSAKQILGFLSKNFEEDRRGMSQSQRFASNRRSDAERVKHGLSMLGVAIGTPLASNAIRGALSRALPSSLQPPGGPNPTPGNPPVNPIPTQQNAGPITPQGPQPPNAPPTPSNPTSPIPTSPIPVVPGQPPSSPISPINPVQTNQKNINAVNILDKHGSKEKVDELLSSKNGPNEIKAFFHKFYPSVAKNIEKEIGFPLDQLIEQYISEKPIEAVNLPQKPTELIEKPPEVVEKPTEVVESNEPIIKNTPVSTPHGIGEVKEVRNGKAIVEVDGKKHQVNESELEPEPEEVKNSKIEFDLNDIPEDLRSAPLNEVYAPAHRNHLTIKFNSNVGQEKEKRYIYYKKDGTPIDESIIEKLRIGVQLPITSGKNFWGAWNSDTEDSRGTVAYHELTKMAQKYGEEDDPSKPYWFEEEEEIFTHGYSKKHAQELRKKAQEFNEKNRKKPKKKRT